MFIHVSRKNFVGASLLLVSLVVFLVSFSASSSQAGTVIPPNALYVDAVHGSDASGDGSQENPWRTISWALSQVSAGDAIVALPGVYDAALGESFPINLPPGGSLIGSGCEQTMLVAQNDLTVVYIGSQTTDILSDTRVSNLTVQGGNIGVAIYSSENHTAAPVIAGVCAHQNEHGIHMTTSDTYEDGAILTPVITNTRVISSGQNGIYMRARGYFSRSDIAPIIANSLIQGGNGRGIHIEAAATGANRTTASPHIVNTRILENQSHGIFMTSSYQGWVEPKIERSQIAGNAGYGLYWTPGINTANLDAVLTNTLIFANQSGGVYFDHQPQPEGEFGAVRLVNCTLADNANYGIYWGRGPREVDPFVVNSILWNPEADDLYASGDGWTTEQIQFSIIGDGDFAGAWGNLDQDPLFSHAYHLGLCSPAIDAGTSQAAPPDDIDGDPRPQGAAPDIGADEFVSPPVLHLFKTVSADQAALDDVLAYTITLTNALPYGSGTITTALQVSLTDALPRSIAYEPGSLWASQGDAQYAAGEILWTDTITPQTSVTISFLARVVQSETSVRNVVVADAGCFGSYSSPVCETRIVSSWQVFLPIIIRSD